MARTGMAAAGVAGLSLAGLVALGAWLAPAGPQAAPTPPALAVVAPATDAPAEAAPALPLADAPDVLLERALVAGEQVAEDCGGALDAEACAVLRAHPTWSVEAARRVAAGHVVLGLTAAQVQAAWDEPVDKTEGPDGRTTWCYDEDCASGVIFLGDRVVGLKE